MAVHAGKADYKDAFAGLVFPTSKPAVLNRCRLKGGIDREVHKVLTLLPERRFRAEDDLYEAVRNVYRSLGVGEDDLPV